MQVAEEAECSVADSLLEKNSNAYQPPLSLHKPSGHTSLTNMMLSRRCAACGGANSKLHITSSTIKGNGRVGALASDAGQISLVDTKLSVLCEAALGATGLNSKVVADRCLLSRNVIGAWAKLDGVIELSDSLLPEVMCSADFVAPSCDAVSEFWF